MKKTVSSAAKKLASVSMLYALLSMLSIAPAMAFCPVCTIAVGGILGLGEWLGVDAILIGIWLGALTLALAMWTANYMHKRGVKNALWYLLIFVVYYAMTLSVYFLPQVHFGAAGGPNNILWGMDKLLMGIIAGSLGMWLGERWYAQIKRKNDGRAQFPFQKVIVPIGVLLVLTAVFAGILYL
ncbi:MAG: hypothetical protein FWC51_02030 [Proteobacteria bacterium]|nr:hypothetical protein [Pseudomonadota bacterium]